MTVFHANKEQLLKWSFLSKRKKIQPNGKNHFHVVATNRYLTTHPRAMYVARSDYAWIRNNFDIYHGYDEHFKLTDQVFLYEITPRNNDILPDQ